MPEDTRSGVVPEEAVKAVFHWLEHEAGKVQPWPGRVTGMLEVAAPIIVAPLLRELEEMREDRDLAIAHDRQPYPTAEAYEKVCAARTKWQERAESAEQKLEEAREAVAVLSAPLGRAHLAARNLDADPAPHLDEAVAAMKPLRTALDPTQHPSEEGTEGEPGEGDKERRDLAQWARDRAVVEDRLLRGAFSAESADHHREMIAKLTQVAAALDALRQAPSGEGGG